MNVLIKVLIGLSALAFVLAVLVTAVIGEKIFGVSAESFSRACSNLALLSIAITAVTKTCDKSASAK